MEQLVGGTPQPLSISPITAGRAGEIRKTTARARCCKKKLLTHCQASHKVRPSKQEQPNSDTVGSKKGSVLGTTENCPTISKMETSEAMKGGNGLREQGKSGIALPPSCEARSVKVCEVRLVKIIKLKKDTGCELETIVFDNGITVSCWQTGVPEVAVYQTEALFRSVRTKARGYSITEEIVI